MIKVILFLSVLNIGIFSWAGGDRVGNGGTIWVCRDTKGVIVKTLFPDIYDTHTSFGIKLMKVDDAIKAWPFQIVRERYIYLQKVNPKFANEIRRYLDRALSNFALSNVSLPASNDAFGLLIPSNKDCPGKWQLEQFANYIDIDTLIVKRELWNSAQVSSIDKAALVWHEAVYHWLRDHHDNKDSGMTRFIVGVLFSDVDFNEMTQINTMFFKK